MTWPLLRARGLELIAQKLQDLTLNRSEPDGCKGKYLYQWLKGQVSLPRPVVGTKMVDISLQVGAATEPTKRENMNMGRLQ